MSFSGKVVFQVGHLTYFETLNADFHLFHYFCSWPVGQVGGLVDKVEILLNSVQFSRAGTKFDLGIK